MISVGTIPKHILEYNWVKSEIKHKKVPNSSGKSSQFTASNIKESCEILLSDSCESRSTAMMISDCPERRAVKKDLAEVAATNEKDSNDYRFWTMSEKIRWLYCYETEQETQGSCSLDDTLR